MEDAQKIGEITHFFSKINVAVLKMTDGELKVGDRIRIKGHTTDFEQPVDSMQVNHESVETARAGDEVGLKTESAVRQNDEVFLI